MTISFTVRELFSRETEKDVYFLLGREIVSLFNYTVFDYEKSQITFYSDSIKIKMNNSEPSYYIYIFLFNISICLFQFLYLYICKRIYKLL